MDHERFGDRDVLLTFEEAANLLRVSRATMYRLLDSGQLVGHKVGRAWRFYKLDLHSFVATAGSRERRPAKAATASEWPAQAANEIPT